MTPINETTWQRLQARAEEEDCSVDDLLNRWLDAEADTKKHESNAMMQLIQHLPLAVAIFDTDICYLQANAAWREQYQLGDIQIVGKSHYEIFPEIGDDWKQIHQRCLRGEVDVNDLAPFPRHDGTQDWIRWEVRPWYVDMEQTHVGGIMMITEVITEDIAIEDALRESALRYGALFEQSNDAIFLITLEGVYLDANQRAQDMLGYTLDELRSLRQPQVVADAEQAASANILERMLAGEQMPLYERTLKRKDGSTFIAEINVNLIHDEMGEVLYIQSIARDISERKQMQQELRASQERYKLLSELNFEGIAIHHQGVIHDVNPAMLRMFGYAREELIGQQVIDLLFTPESSELIRSHIREQYARPYEVTGIRKDGSQFPAEIEARQIAPDLRVASLRDITERKKTEAALHERDLLFKQAFDTSPDAINLNRIADGLYINVNNGFCDITGYSRDEVIGQTSLELNIWAHDGDRDRVVQELNRRGAVDDLEAEFRHKDGSIIIGLMSARILTYLGEDIILSVTRDITAWKRASAALRESEEKYRLLAENASDLVYRVRFMPDMCFEYVSPSSTAMVGYTPEEHYADPELGLKLVHPDDRHLLANLTENGLSKPLVLRWIRKDGSVMWTEQNNTPFFDADGNLVAIEGIARNITDRKRIEDDLRQSEEKYRLLVENSYQGIMIEQPDPIRIVFASRSVESILGYKPEELMAMDEDHLRALAHPDDQKKFAKHFQTCLEGHSTNPTIQIRVNHADGSIRYLDVHRARISYNGSPATQATFVDVTDRIESERLKAQFQKEQSNNELILRVVSMLSHDLRTPLAVIASSRDILSRYFDRLSAERRQEKLDTISRQIQFALELLDDTINIARGNLSERQFNPVKINLATLCQVSVDEISFAKNTEYNIRFVPVGDIEIAAVDEILVSRILLNLLSNAIKYSPDGGEVCLELDSNDDWIVLRVIDQGNGIDEADLPHIFDPFYRADEIKNISGTGLGLSIVQDCVDRHQGRIHVESMPGKGSTFTIELPLNPEPA